MAWKTFLSCDMDNIVILRLSNPKHAPLKLNFRWPSDSEEKCLGNLIRATLAENSKVNHHPF